MAKKDNKKNQRPEKERYSKGFIDVSGRDGFYRPVIEVSRWSLGMQILKDNFGSLVGLNVFMILFVAPIFVILFLRSGKLAAEIASAPFAANIGPGFQPNPNMMALPETLVFGVDRLYFLFLPLAVVWLGLGLSGAMYVMRNLCWGERVRVYKTFLLGVKHNALSVVIGAAIYSLILTGGIIGCSFMDLSIALNGGAWYYILTKVVLIVVIVYATLWFMTYVSMAVSYKANVFSLMKNSVVMTTVLLPFNVFFAALSFIGFALTFLGASFMWFGVLLVALIAVSFAMLVWSTYSQWLFDRFVNPKIKNKYVPTEEEVRAKKLRDEYAKRQQEAGDGFITVGTTVTRDLGDIMPIDKGSVEMVRFNGLFTRDDILKASERKKEMLDDVAAEEDTSQGEGAK